MSTFLRPNSAKVERRQTTGTVSNTGTPVPAAPTTIYTELPCMIDSVSALRGFELTATGGQQPITIGSDMLICDGANIHGTPGESVTVNGVAMVIAPNGRAAFPDVQKGDRITREDGLEYLAIGVHRFSDVFPNLQADLQLGKAWG